MIGRLVARRTVRSAAIWAVIFGIYAASKAIGVTEVYPSRAALSAAAQQFAGDQGINALVGRPRYLDTLPGEVQWNILQIMAVLAAIWALLAATKYFRGEEDAGRWEILLGGPITARSAARNALGGLFASTALLFAMCAAFFMGVGADKAVDIAPGPMVLLAFAVALACAMFVSIGALTSQLVPSRGRAAGLAAGVLGVSFLVRSLGDITSATWLLHFTPLGWLEQISPLSHTEPLWILPPLALVVACSGLTVFLAGRRDVGTGIIAVSDSSAPHTRMLNSPMLAAVRLTRTASLVWIAAFVLVGALYASFTHAGVASLQGSPNSVQIFQRLSHANAAFAEAYLGIAFLLLMLLMCVYTATAMGSIRDEEASGRLDNFLIRPFGRMRWLAGRVALVTAVIVCGGVLGGVGSWIGLGNQVPGISFGTLFAAGLNTIVPSLFVLGAGLLALGLWPRRTIIIAYAVLGWSFLIVMLSSGIYVPSWIQDTSLLHHIVFAPAAPPNWETDGVITAIAVGLCMVGTTLFDRRDLVGE